MATNPYFSQGVRSEQGLFEDIVIESLKMYGQDIYYLPRDIVAEDKLMNEDIQSRFNSAYKVEMWIENVDGFDGEGDLFTKFGVEIRDQATFVLSKRRWTQTVARFDNEITLQRPGEGDLLYIPFSKKLFEITHVEHEQPFYQLQNLPTFKLRCELFEYAGEDMSTGVELIDDVERDYAYTHIVNVDVSGGSVQYTDGEIVTQAISDTVDITGKVAKWIDSDGSLFLTQVGASDGKLHSFVVGGNDVIGATSQAEAGVLSTSEDNKLSETEDNTYFDTLTDFLDFSESNPFGEPS